ncbi:MAG: threonine ammonia-lyase [Pseudomonadota bacterium]|nr:threonine ammonia-lyase [Pseudomonadota bacterium]
MAVAVTPEDIREASRIIHGQVVRTPLIAAPKLSELCGADIWIKYENLQFTNSFKVRGALVKLLSLDAAARRQGVIAVSAGNHAQAVAYHAARLQIPATIVMPETTPFVKVANTEALGATVVLSGATIAEARSRVQKLAAEKSLTMVHPFDDPLIIAGQGTVGLELLEDQPDLDAIVIPVGGGGLIAGTAIAAKAIRPDVDIFGVEVDSYCSMYDAMAKRKGKYGGQTLAEGIAVKAAGTLTRPVVEKLVTEILLVPESAIERAIYVLLTQQKTMAEGAGAAGLAAVVENRARFEGRKVCIVLTGGNIDGRILASIMVRGLERDNKIVSLRITIADQPGVLGQIATTLGKSGANILEVSHRRLLLDVPAKGATLDVLIETKDASHAEEVISDMRKKGFDVHRLDAEGAGEIGTR